MQKPKNSDLRVNSDSFLLCLTAFLYMEYVYAALMLHKLEKEVNEANVTSVVKATGAEVNEAQVKALVASLADVNIEEAIKAAPVAVAAAAAPAADAPAEGGDDKKEKKAEPPSEKQEEAAMEGLSSLFC